MYHHRGSIWTKWDLHFHTPASYDYQDHKVTNQQIVETLVDDGVRLVAITDHHTIDVERIREIRQLGENRLTVLPGIELRSELGGSQSVHFIGIFPENADLGEIWIKLQGKLGLTPADIQKRGGDERIYADLKQAADLIHELGGLVSVHGGRKSNSVEMISNKELFKQALKSDLLRDHVDIVELGQPQDHDDYEGIVFPAIRKRLPLLIGSDNHRVTEYAIKAVCWVKADPCFSGLKKVLVEPQDRVYIGSQPPKLNIVRQQPAKYIKSVRIQKRSNSSLDEIWFDNVELKFNHNLIAIIGNKGTGKSALADVLALLGDTSNHVHFSFLNPKRFQTPSLNRSDHFEAILTWENSRSTSTTRLSKKIEATAVETAKYIPEGMFEEICNEMEAGNASKFECELKQVIFSHVPVADRLGKDSLDALIAYKTEQTDDAIETLKSELADMNAEIARLENQLKPEHRQQIEKQIAIKTGELEDHNAQKPKDVPPPENQATPESAAIATQLEAAKQQREELDTQISTTKRQEADHKILVEVSKRALEKIGNFQKQFKNFKEELSEELEKLGLNFDDIVKMTIETLKIANKHTQSTNLVQAAEAQLDENRDDSLLSQLKAVQENIQSLQDKLDEPNRVYQAYLTALRSWEQKQDQIVGSADQQGSLKYYQSKLAGLDQLPDKLQAAKQQRIEIVKQIHARIRQLADTYRQLYQPVQKFIDEHPLVQKTLQLNFAVSIDNLDLQSKFFDWIGRNVVGSFYGTHEGDKVLNELTRRHDFDTEGGVLAFLDDLLDHLTHDKRTTSSPTITIETQLKKNKDTKGFYDYIFSLDYLRPRYLLRMSDKEIGQLSPGERGALLLIFYLLVDRDQNPVIIDQPEANLDNQTVYELLVNAIKEAKNHRQIFIVTHNPNLAVVCDAEQVICCDIDKQNGNKITYTSGSIENPVINKKIVDILEGTMPAFDNRRSKYERLDWV